MKIPSNTILAIGGLVGSIVTAASAYWIGRRCELDQIINIGRVTEDETGFRALDMFDSKGRPVALYVRSEDR